MCSFYWKIFMAHDKIYTGVRREPDGGKLSSAVNGPDICRQRTRQNLHRCLLGTRQWQIVVCRQRARRLPSTSPTSAVNGPDVCRQRARQNLHRCSLGARRWQIVVCRQLALRLPSTYPTISTLTFIGSPTVANCCLPSTGTMSAVNPPDKPIQSNYAMSAVDGPDICHLQVWCLLSRGQTSATNLHNVCHQLAENLLLISLIKEILASWQAHVLVNWLDQVRLG